MVKQTKHTKYFDYGIAGGYDLGMEYGLLAKVAGEQRFSQLDEGVSCEFKLPNTGKRMELAVIWRIPRKKDLDSLLYPDPIPPEIEVGLMGLAEATYYPEELIVYGSTLKEYAERLLAESTRLIDEKGYELAKDEETVDGMYDTWGERELNMLYNVQKDAKWMLEILKDE